MAPIETIPWDPADRLKTRESIVAYLEAVYEDDDPELILDDVLGDCAAS